MARVPYYKLSGAGNDFIALVEPRADPTPQWIRRVCRRGVSLGADGVFVLRRQENGRILMAHFNADGGRAELCLNGTRCAVRLCSELGWGDEPVIVTDSGEIRCHKEDRDWVALSWNWTSPKIVTKRLIVGDDEEVSVGLVDVGVPYAILVWEQPLEIAPVEVLGRAIRGHQGVGPRGANVAFVYPVSSNRVRMRSFERGVEAETLASGTGVIASAWCLATGSGFSKGSSSKKSGSLDSGPFTVETTAGFELVAEFSDARARLGGDARLLAQGEIFG